MRILLHKLTYYSYFIGLSITNMTFNFHNDEPVSEVPPKGKDRGYNPVRFIHLISIEIFARLFSVV